MAIRKKLLTYEEQLKQQGVEIKRLRFMLEQKNTLQQTSTRDYTDELLDLDLQQYVSRYKWSGLPNYIPQDFIEKMLYFKGSLAGFFEKGQLVILPYAIEGSLNIYGYPTKIEPVAINGKSFGHKKLNTYPTGEVNKNAESVILYDRCPISTTGLTVPKAVQDTDILSLMNETLIKSEVNLVNSVKKLVYKVNTESQASETRKDLNVALNSNDPFIIVTEDSTSTNENNVLNSGVELETEKIMQYFSSLNNYRCYKNGIKNNGVFEKMERVVTGELTGNEYQTNLILETGLAFRKTWLEYMKDIYPEYKNILNKITVEINIDPYISKAPGSDIEDDTFAERKGETSKEVENA